jgi:hypothetical protein
MNRKWKRTKRFKQVVLSTALMLAGTYAFGGNSWTDEYFGSSCQLTTASITGPNQHFTGSLTDEGTLVDPGINSATDGTFICSSSLSTSMTPSFLIRDITFTMGMHSQATGNAITPTCNIYIETKSGTKVKISGNSDLGNNYDAARLYFGCPAARSDGQVMLTGYKVNLTYVQSS